MIFLEIARSMALLPQSLCSCKINKPISLSCDFITYYRRRPILPAPYRYVPRRLPSNWMSPLAPETPLSFKTLSFLVIKYPTAPLLLLSHKPKPFTPPKLQMPKFCAWFSRGQGPLWNHFFASLCKHKQPNHRILQNCPIHLGF